MKTDDIGARIIQDKDNRVFFVHHTGNTLDMQVLENGCDLKETKEGSTYLLLNESGDVHPYELPAAPASETPANGNLDSVVRLAQNKEGILEERTVNVTGIQTGVSNVLSLIECVEQGDYLCIIRNEENRYLAFHLLREGETPNARAQELERIDVDESAVKPKQQQKKPSGSCAPTQYIPREKTKEPKKQHPLNAPSSPPSSSTTNTPPRQQEEQKKPFPHPSLKPGQTPSIKPPEPVVTLEELIALERKEAEPDEIPHTPLRPTQNLPEPDEYRPIKNEEEGFFLNSLRLTPPQHISAGDIQDNKIWIPPGRALFPPETRQFMLQFPLGGSIVSAVARKIRKGDTYRIELVENDRQQPRSQYNATIPYIPDALDRFVAEQKLGSEILLRVSYLQQANESTPDVYMLAIHERYGDALDMRMDNDRWSSFVPSKNDVDENRFCLPFPDVKQALLDCATGTFSIKRKGAYFTSAPPKKNVSKFCSAFDGKHPTLQQFYEGLGIRPPEHSIRMLYRGDVGNTAIIKCTLEKNAFR